MQSKVLKMKGLNDKSAFYDSIAPDDSTGYWNYWTCANVTEYDNSDGTHTTIYDYGEGCDEFGSLTKGTITYIWRNEGSDYYSKVLYDHYSSWGMEMNGYSEYSFESNGSSYVEYDSTGLISDSSSFYTGVAFYWMGTSKGNDTITVTYDTGEKYSYTSNYSNKWDENSYTVLEGEYSYISEPYGYSYHYLVSEPLISNYACWNTWVPVTGIESIHYNDLSETYGFTIDYGDGACDNLATITENGESSVIDFGELMIYYCGTDSISVPCGKK